MSNTRLRRPTLSTSLVAAGLLCASNALAQGRAAETTTDVAAVPTRFVDRGHDVLAVRDGAVRVEAGQRLEHVALRSGRFRYHAWVGEEAIVQLAPDADVTATLARHGLRAVRALMPAASLWLVRDARDGVSSLDVAARLVSAVAAHDGLTLATPDLWVERTPASINVPPNDPRYRGQWFFSRINIEAAWRRVTGDRATTVVVVDDGCELDHPDLAANMLPGTDVLSRDDDPTPSGTTAGFNHGTSCAGIVAAATDNNLGVAGACPECTLRCVRLLGARGTPVPVSADVAAMNFARDTNAAVVSNSWGFVEAQPVPGPFAMSMEYLYDHGRNEAGTLVVFAAGNDSREITSDELFGVRGVVTVGAINNFDEVAQYSNVGEPLALTAPLGTLTADLTGPAGDDPTDYTANFGGTSSACPVVAGVAALLFSARPTATAAEVRAALLASARPAPFAQPDAMGHDNTYGYGVVDPAGALRRLFGEPEPVDASTPDSAVTDAASDVATDGAATDVVTARDAGVSPSADDGCGCHARRSDKRAGALALGLIAVALTRRRRRR